MTVFSDQTQINCQLNRFWKNRISQFSYHHAITPQMRELCTLLKKIKGTLWKFVRSQQEKNNAGYPYCDGLCNVHINTLTKQSLQQLILVLSSLIVPHMLVFMPDNIRHALNETKEGVIGDLSCQISIRTSLKSWTVWGAWCSRGVCGDDRCPHTSNSQCCGSGITSRT